MSAPSRREFVQGAGAAGAFLFFVPPRRRNPMDDIVKRIIDTPRDKVFEVVEPMLREGLPWQELQAAVFQAGILEIQPRPVGFKLHAVMVVESMFQLAEASPEPERLLPVLWNLDDFKNSQARDQREGDWHLPPRPEVAGFASPDAAARELVAALEAWDSERADRAVVGAWPVLGHAGIFELLWPFAMRDFTNLGHKPIFCSHVERVLTRLQDARAEEALRSLVFGLLDAAPGQHTEGYAASRAIAAKLEPGWDAGKRDPDKGLSLALALRPMSSDDARAAVAAALVDGLHPDSVWDALRLVAADLFARRPELLPVHPTTVTSAMRYIFDTSQSDTTRAAALLQAASWLPLFRAALRMSVDSGGLDPLLAPADLEHVCVEELFADPSPMRARACLEAPAHADDFAKALRANLIRGAREHHQPKYAAAILEDVRTADPRWHPALLSTALEYLPSSKTEDTELSQRSRELLANLPH